MFEYTAETAGADNEQGLAVEVHYVDIHHDNKNVGNQSFTASDLRQNGTLPVASNTIQLGSTGASNGSNVLELLQVPTGYHLVHAINPITLRLHKGKVDLVLSI